MISASASMKRRINQGQAILSVLGRSRVIHFMTIPWQIWRGLGPRRGRGAGVGKGDAPKPHPQREVVSGLDQPGEQERQPDGDRLRRRRDGWSEGSAQVAGGARGGRGRGALGGG